MSAFLPECASSAPPFELCEVCEFDVCGADIDEGYLMRCFAADGITGFVGAIWNTGCHWDVFCSCLLSDVVRSLDPVVLLWLREALLTGCGCFDVVLRVLHSDPAGRITSTSCEPLEVNRQVCSAVDSAEAMPPNESGHDSVQALSIVYPDYGAEDSTVVTRHGCWFHLVRMSQWWMAANFAGLNWQLLLGVVIGSYWICKLQSSGSDSPGGAEKAHDWDDQRIQLSALALLLCGLRPSLWFGCCCGSALRSWIGFLLHLAVESVDDDV
ncbi:hypothetical protein Nepgr_016355 [Nepenthes gracilis]|uniref:Uncharacterized protein n=1 Tax=Nepenthes gracilis TaxID=150966 RepID=A0AAD3SPK8_NEPGR|nr:hypothetical protein Nepgr_016355 [Nepenthes gracilis]